VLASGGIELRAAEHPAFTRAVRGIVRDERVVGRLGLLHPDVERRLDLTGPIYLFEIYLDALAGGQLPAFAPLSKFPSIPPRPRIVVDRGLSFAQVRDCVRRAAPAIVKKSGCSTSIRVSG